MRWRDDAVQAADFNDPAYLTETSQLHFESVTTAIGLALSILSSLVVEPSRRSALRSTSLEAELPFICIDDLLTRIKDLVCTVAHNILAKTATRPR